MKRGDYLTILILAIFMQACQSKISRQSLEMESMSSADSLDYFTRGAEMVATSFQVLSSHLLGAIEEGGIGPAVQYCHISAYPIIDSLSRKHRAQIRRSSLRIRSPENSPTANERTVLKDYAEKKNLHIPLEPVLVQIDQTVSYHAPIIMAPLCLNCHGERNQDISEEDFELLNSLYPDDQAVGYEAGDLRGIWSIYFDEKNF